MESPEVVFSISEYIELINGQLKMYEARIVGEVTQLKVGPTGHVYFTLRDKEKGASLDCIIWRSTYHLFGILLEVGMEVLVSGKAQIYAPSGRFSFIAHSLQVVGEGVLKKRYDLLKRKLSEEGLFLSERKKALPQFPHRIGVITSKQGAVIHDFMNNIGRHGFAITFLDARVEGSEALPELYRALRLMKQRQVEVIVLMRGGGSLQSLAAFDAEALVREVSESSIPIIAAIGHHQDVPLAALVADVHVSTPTAAATLLSSGYEKGLLELSQCENLLLRGYRQLLSDTALTLQVRKEKITATFQALLRIFTDAERQLPRYISQVQGALMWYRQEQERHLQHLMTHLADGISEQTTAMQSIWKESIQKSFSYHLRFHQQTVATQATVIDLHNPLRLLSLGYSLIRGRSGQLVKHIKDVTIGERVSLVLTDGTLIAAVEKAEKE